MALDSREKRASAMGVGRPWYRTKHPVGATDEQSRMNTGNVYGGNALSVTIVVLSINMIADLVSKITTVADLESRSNVVADLTGGSD